MTRRDLADAVAGLGVRRGDVLLVHSSMRALGPFDGGPDAVIDGLLDALGPEGLLVMPTFTRSRIDEARPEAALPFDPAVTPCRERTGIIPDTFWRRPGTARSGHPTHSLAAFGPRAGEFVEGGTVRTFDPSGPFGRYSRWGGRALFVGVLLGSNTTFHCAEDWMGLPFLTEGQALLGKDGTGCRAVSISGCPTGCRAYYGGGGRPARELEARGLIRRYAVSQTSLMLINSRDIVATCAEMEEREPGFLLCADTPHDFCRSALEASRASRSQALAGINRLRASRWMP